MIMPDRSERRPYHQREKHQWEHEAPESSLIRHF
jgi:hypothetical protein